MPDSFTVPIPESLKEEHICWTEKSTPATAQYKWGIKFKRTVQDDAV